MFLRPPFSDLPQNIKYNKAKFENYKAITKAN